MQLFTSSKRESCLPSFKQTTFTLVTVSKMQASRRVRILEQFNQGIENPSVISVNTGIPLSTVYRITKNLREGKGIQRQEGSGRPRKLGEVDRRRLGQFVRHGKFKSVAYFQQRLIERGSPVVCQKTIYNELHRLDWEKKRAIPTPPLTDVQKQRRFDWCRAHVDFDWENVFFTDESSVWLFPSFVKKWTKTNETAVFERPKHCPKFHMWGGVSSRGATPLCIFEENLTKELYVEILKDFLLPTAQVLYENDWWLQQDNDPKHTARYTKQWFLDENLHVLDFPSYSPDLNPIENIWGCMKTNLYSQRISDFETMKRESARFWDTMTHDFIQSFVMSMPRRIELCIARLGGKIDF